MTKQAARSVPSRRNQRRRVDVLVRGSYAMKPRLCSLAAAVVFVLCPAAGVFAADTDDDPCSGAKPFREVAQDEIHTMAELCRMQEESRRENGRRD